MHIIAPEPHFDLLNTPDLVLLWLCLDCNIFTVLSIWHMATAWLTTPPHHPHLLNVSPARLPILLIAGWWHHLWAPVPVPQKEYVLGPGPSSSWSLHSTPKIHSNTHFKSRKNPLILSIFKWKDFKNLSLFSTSYNYESMKIGCKVTSYILVFPLELLFQQKLKI